MFIRSDSTNINLNHSAEGVSDGCLDCDSEVSQLFILLSLTYLVVN